MRRPKLAAAMVVSLALTGGAVLLNASPASASNAGGGLNCTSFRLTEDLSAAVPGATGTVSGCNSNRDGTLTTAVIDVTGGIQPLHISWAKGHATSVGTVRVTNVDFFGHDGCPGADTPVTLDVEITGGPHAGTGGVNTVCGDLSAFPIVTFTNVGTFHL